MKQRCDGFDEPSFWHVSREKYINLKFQDDCIVFGKDLYREKSLTCRNLTVDGNFFLIGDLCCNDIDIKGNCIIYGNIYSCRKVKVQGDLCIYETSESINRIEGGCFSPFGDVEVGGNLICMYMIRAGSFEIKVGGDIITRYVECKAISVAGECNVYPGVIDASEAVYVLGDITTGFAIEAKEVYCGGKYTRLFQGEKECAIIHEYVQHWNKLT